MARSVHSKVLPAALTVAAVALIMGLFGHALFEFAQEREKTGSRSKIVTAMINALPDRDGDARFAAEPVKESPGELIAAAVAKPAASASTAAVTSTPSSENKALAEVERIQRKWAALWSQRDAQGFLKLYDPDFPDFQRHAQTRTHRMAAANFIAVEIQDLKLIAAEEDTVVARFTQHYRSDAYQDSVTKEVRWKRSMNGYRIVSEKTMK